MKNVIGDKLCIPLRKGDVVLERWNTKAKEKEGGIRSILIREALIYYSKTGKFMDIGHVYVMDSSVVQGKVLINTWIEGSEELKIWLQSLNKGRELTKLVREILRNCITVVSTLEEEWIPGYLDIDRYKRTLGNVSIILELPKVEVKTEVKPVIVEESKKVQEEKTEMVDVKQEKRAIRAMSFGSKRTKIN